jgi:hypothetical protein
MTMIMITTMMMNKTLIFDKQHWFDTENGTVDQFTGYGNGCGGHPLLYNYFANGECVSFRMNDGSGMGDGSGYNIRV